jgi:Domain of unknown function (DUF4424)
MNGFRGDETRYEAITFIGALTVSGIEKPARLMKDASKFAGAAVLALTIVARAGANDSTSELAAGGLVLTKNDAIEMRSEDLYISAAAVRVRYRFINTSPQDVAVTVAFPMPDITMEGIDDMLAVPTESPTNFLAFTTVVDGQPVTAQVEQKVIKKGVDQTAYLRGLGVPLAPHLAATNKILDRLPKARQRALVRLGLAVDNDYDVGKGMEHHLAATWTLKTNFYWNQIFPVGREVIVEHRYKPSVGRIAQTLWGSTDWPKDPRYAERRRHYCVDDDFVAAAERARRPRETSPPLTERRLEYVLTTGANWKVPIGDFHMLIDKGDPTNLVSFCGDGVRKTGATTFEVHYTNFTPTRDVSVLILKRLPSS